MPYSHVTMSLTLQISISLSHVTSRHFIFLGLVKSVKYQIWSILNNTRGYGRASWFSLYKGFVPNKGTSCHLLCQELDCKIVRRKEAFSMAAHSAISLMPSTTPSLKIRRTCHRMSCGSLLALRAWMQYAWIGSRRSNSNNNRMIMHAIIPRSQMALCLDSGEH